MINRIRPRHGPVALKDGFYVEICRKGMKTGIKIHCEDRLAVDKSIVMYEKFKTVIILGQYKSGFPLEHSYTYVAPAIAKPAAQGALPPNDERKLWIDTVAAPRRVRQA